MQVPVCYLMSKQCFQSELLPHRQIHLGWLLKMHILQPSLDAPPRGEPTSAGLGQGPGGPQVMPVSQGSQRSDLLKPLTFETKDGL